MFLKRKPSQNESSVKYSNLKIRQPYIMPFFQAKLVRKFKVYVCNTKENGKYIYFTVIINCRRKQGSGQVAAQVADISRYLCVHN